jgi:uncharacterized membrane protein
MHSLLENYLAEVAAHLGPLPAKRRAEELREMRAHLEAALAAGLERGQAEDEAARGVRAQFGTPEAVGAETVAVWRRGKRRTVKSFLGAALVTLAALNTVPYLVEFLLHRFVASWPDHVTFWVTRNLAAWALMGAVTGLSSPKRAVAGTAFVMGSFFLWDMADFFEFNVHNTPFPQGSPRWMEYLLFNLWYTRLIPDITLLLTAVATAWLGSRRRRRGGVRLARG